MLKITDLFVNNLSLLKKNNPDIFIDENISTDMYRLEKGKNAFVTCKVEVNGKMKYMHSKYDPVKEAETIISESNPESGGAVLCFGFGFGHHIRLMLKKITKRSSIYIVEPNAGFFTFALKSADLTDILGDTRVKILLEFSELNLKDYFIRNINMPTMTKSKIICWPIYEELYPEKWAEFTSAIKYLSSFHGMETTSRVFLVRSSHINLLRNLQYYLNGYHLSGFRDTYVNKPLIIVSAGPSLSKNIETLKKAKGKALIVAVYSSKDILKNYDIKADFITTIDPMQTVFERDNGINIVQEEPLVCFTYSDTFLLEAATGGIIFAKGKPQDYLTDDNTLVSGGTVAVISISLACALGANPIIFVGQDLAFEGNKTHADGTMHRLIDNDTPETGGYGRIIMTKGLYGDDVCSAESFIRFKTEIETMIAKHKDKKFIDATEGGAYIEGTEIMTLQEALNAYCEADINIDEYFGKSFETSKCFKGLDDKFEFLNKLKEASENIKSLYDTLKDALEYSQKIAKSVMYESSKKHKDMLRYQKRTEELKKEIFNMEFERSLMMFIILLLEPQLVAIMENDEDQFYKLARFNIVFFNNFRLAARETMPFLELVIKDIEEKLDKERSEQNCE